MKNEQINIYDSHHEVWELIPWYVNGSMDDDEKTIVEAHFKVCLMCRAELSEQMKLEQKIQDVDLESLEATRGFAVLRQRIEQNNPKQSTRFSIGRLLEPIHHFVSAIFNLRAAVVAVGAIAIVLGVNSMMNSNVYQPQISPSSPPAEFRTLAAVADLTLDLSREILVVFSNTANENEISETLKEAGVERIHGPNDAGLIRVRVLAEKADRETTASVLAMLKASDIVFFAEPTISAE